MENKRLSILGCVLGFTALGLLLSATGYCSVESSLDNVQSKVQMLLPILATVGLGFAGVSFLTGNQNARSHLMLAIIGAVVGFGASSIMDIIRRVVN